MRFLLILLLMAASASAKVIVYKGSGRTALPDATSTFGPLPHVYLVVDLTTQQGYLLCYYSVAAKKKSTIFLPYPSTHYVSRPISAKRTVGVFGMVLDTSIGSSIGVNLFYLRGDERPLFLSTEVGVLPSNYPRTLSGPFRVAQFNNIPSIYELNLTLSFDAVHTQIANNTLQSGQQTLTSISDELTQKGY